MSLIGVRGAERSVVRKGPASTTRDEYPSDQLEQRALFYDAMEGQTKG